MEIYNFFSQKLLINDTSVSWNVKIMLKKKKHCNVHGTMVPSDIGLDYIVLIAFVLTWRQLDNLILAAQCQLLVRYEKTCLNNFFSFSLLICILIYLIIINMKNFFIIYIQNWPRRMPMVWQVKKWSSDIFNYPWLVLWTSHFHIRLDFGTMWGRWLLNHYPIWEKS